MSDTLISLLPYIIGTAVVPAQIIITILLLKNPRQGLLKAVLFVVGMTAARLLQGLVFGYIFDLGDSSDAADANGLIKDTLLLVLGILLLVAAYRKWAKEPDPDDAPPRWMALLDRVTVQRAFLIGFAMPLISPKLWVFLLGALSAIDYAQIGQPESVLAFLLFLLFAQSLLLVPILARILLPQRSASLLETVSTWLERYNRPIMIAVSLIFGILFLYQGVTGFIR